MKIEHTAIYVIDIELTKKFYIDYFGASASEMYHNKKTGFKSYFLTFDGGSRLEIMTRGELLDEEKNQYRCGYAHIAMSIGTKEAVDAKTKILRDAGYRLLSEPRTTGDGYYESCVEGPENNIIEITI